MGWVEDYIGHCKRLGRSPVTIETYQICLNLWRNRYGLDLSTCDKETLLKALDRHRENHSPRYVHLQVILIKAVLKFLGRKDLADEVLEPKRPDPEASIKVIAPEDVQKLIQKAPSLRDRLIFELLHETGARRGEIVAMRIRDVQFDEYGAIIWLKGKSGIRRRRVYASVPDLRDYINNHPRREDPDSPLWLTFYGEPFTNHTLYRRIKVLGKRILGKPIYPHMFRHTRATEDSRYFTDREMMMLFGWKHADMCSIYSHLSMRDVEEKDLVLHGLKKKEQVLRPLVKIQVCPECGQENAPVAVYCVKCGAVLPNEQVAVMKKLLNDPPFIERVIKRVLEEVVPNRG